ncbi:glycosyltransferase [Williamsia sterculiae]|uniref:Glycosyltransferase involved in cell wall bisynthesis n=1 Tax=Williamsia sterculiae TaxID=1344003 RepID=A0A1N7CZU3_9NOCA|nr:glycosyltransferase [Williamsia sterculiae]SIR68984.1 Glycosyltransferase involved in cell wall bisynthesis [Williamsia sterculiae]
MGDLSDHRLIYLAPRSGIGGIGDYADDFLAAVSPYFGDVVVHRHAGPGADTTRQIAAQARRVQSQVDTSPWPTIVHCEVGGGAVLPFWATSGVRDAPVSYTVHDPPGMVWWPARTRFLAQNRLLNHGLHYPLRPVAQAVERKVVADRTLFTLSRIGARALQQRYPRAAVHAEWLLIPDRPPITPAWQRPRAIGFFGLVYRGKGFELIEQIRAALPDDITIRIAGRGTEKLPGGPGIEILGEVNGDAEDAFFASIRALVVPYGQRSIYGDAFPASATVTRAYAYRTPVVARRFGALAELDDDGGAVVVDGGPAEIAGAAAGLLDDASRLADLAVEADRLAGRRNPEQLGRRFAQVWSESARAGDTAAAGER